MSTRAWPTGPAERRVSLAAASTILVLLAFSDEFLSAVVEGVGGEYRGGVRWLLVPVDLLILLVVFAQRRRFRRRVGGGPGTGTLPWWLAGASLTLGADVLMARFERHAWLDLVAAPVYVVALAILFTATMYVRPRLLVSPRARAANESDWLLVRGVVPLLLGVLGAYLATLWWEYGRRGTGMIDQEFFAQLSQVIALLIVALGIEVGFYRTAVRDATLRAMATLSLAILCLGEGMALSALVAADPALLSPWHAYLAFILTVNACLVALATLVWVLVVRPAPDRPVEPAPAPAPVVPRDQPTGWFTAVAAVVLATATAVAVRREARRRP